MRRNASFIRKVVYIAIIALLLIPLSMLSQPATTSGSPESPSGEDSEQSGGKLARLRDDYDLSQANLGEIDPASETMKLATLGMKGIAANMLWHQANEYKKKKMWDRLAVTVRQITKLQPNFETVWEFQAHNLAYNVSVEFDNYEHRYHWVKKGLDFLMEGTKYNSSAHRLFWYTGWIVGQKIGRADEFKEFRAMFKEETDYRAKLEGYVRGQISQLPLILQGEFDNWIMAHLWFARAEKLQTLPRAKPLKMTKPVFFQSSAKALINYARAISDEVRPELNGITQQAWIEGAKAWHKFGDYRMRTPWDDVITLNRLETEEALLQKLREKLDEEVAPGVRDAIANEKRAAMRRTDPKLLAAFDEVQSAEDLASLPNETRSQAMEAELQLAVTDEEVAARAPNDKKRLAEETLEKISRARDEADHIRMYRGHTNFEYWRLRCKAESEDDAILARQAMFDARELADDLKLTSVEKLDENNNVIPKLDKDGKPILDDEGNKVYVMEDGARQKFEKAWDHWWNIFKQPEYQSLAEDIDTDTLMIPIREYRNVLIRLNERELPIDFKLLPLLTDDRREQFGIPTADNVINSHTELPRRELDKASDLAKRGVLTSEPKKDKDGMPIPKKDAKGNDVVDKDGNAVYEIQVGARETFEAAFAQWADLLAKGPPQLLTRSRTESLVAAIPKYRELVKKLGEADIPVDSPLMDFLAARGGNDDLPTPAEIRAAHAGAKPNSENGTATKPTEDTGTGAKSDTVPSTEKESDSGSSASTGSQGDSPN